MNLWYISFILGLGSSLHCSLMCSPLFEWISGNTAAGRLKPLLRYSAYHSARIFVYALLGIITSFLAIRPNVASIQILPLLLSIVLVLIILIYETSSLTNPIIKPFTRFRSGILNLQKGQHKPVVTVLVSGIINGFLPCAAVGFALSLCLQSAGVLDAAAMMVAFGIGNIPGLLLIPLWKKSGLPFPTLLSKNSFWGILLLTILLFRLGSLLFYLGTDQVLIPGLMLCEP